MPRVHTQKANKDYPDHGIKKGDTYYWWKFRYGGKRISLTQPRSSQLTTSEFLSRLYSIQESQGDLDTEDNLAEWVRSTIVDLREMADEQDEKFNNLPDNFQMSDNGQKMEARANACNIAADSLEEIDLEGKPEEPGEGAKPKEVKAYEKKLAKWKQNLLDEIQAVDISEE